MTTCLIALGSNVGDRASALDAAVHQLSAEPDVALSRRSRWYPTRPVGGVALDREFLNGAVLIETALEPEELLNLLQRIETEHGRERLERWANRTLDLDLLLYGERIIDSPRLTLPHPRMSFRRFVLEPVAEIAGDDIHPVIGWKLDQLLRHLDAGADCVAIVSPSEEERREVSRLFAECCGAAELVTPAYPNLVRLWPAGMTSWLSIPMAARSRGADAAGYSAASHPKLTILVTPISASDDTFNTTWEAIVRQPGRGPTLHIPADNRRELPQEALAAVQAVWPHLGPSAE